MSKKPAKRRVDKSQFVEGFDGYRGEYNWWLANASQVLNAPLEVVRLDADVFYEATLEDVVAAAGHPEYKPIYYNVEVDNSKAGKDRGSLGSGFAFAAYDHFGKVRPFICIRDGRGAADADPIIDGHIDLLVLLHELGHADDIAKSINYDHPAEKLDLVGAEVHAHEFVVRHSRRCGYRVLLGYYLDNIKEWCDATDDSVKLPAEQFCTSNSLPELREWSKPMGQAELTRFLHKCGRADDVKKRYGN